MSPLSNELPAQAVEVEVVGWLVQWLKDGEEWVDCHADEPRAVDQARHNKGECIELITLSSHTAVIAAKDAEIERLTKERGEAHRIANALTRTLVDLTPSGSEYFTRNVQLDDYFADAEACTKAVRGRYDAGHQAKIDRVDERRRAEAAEARANAAEKERDALRAKDGRIGPELWGRFPGTGVWHQIADGSNTDEQVTSFEATYAAAGWTELRRTNPFLSALKEPSHDH